MFGLFQNIIVMLFSVFFSLFSALFGFLEDGGGILDWNTPEMSLYTQSSQGDGTAVELSGYGGENPQDPAFLKELLNEYQPETFSAEAGERAEVQMRQLGRSSSGCSTVENRGGRFVVRDGGKRCFGFDSVRRFTAFLYNAGGRRQLSADRP